MLALQVVAVYAWVDPTLKGLQTMKRVMDEHGVDFFSYTWIYGSGSAQVRSPLSAGSCVAACRRQRPRSYAPRELKAGAMLHQYACAQMLVDAAKRSDDNELMELINGVQGVSFHTPLVVDPAAMVRPWCSCVTAQLRRASYFHAHSGTHRLATLPALCRDQQRRRTWLLRPCPR